MTIPSLATLDVRDILKSGGEPFAEIMQAIASLSPGQGLRLLATFKPVPLFGIMAQRGFGHTEREIGGGDWEVIFTPSDTDSQRPLAREHQRYPAARKPRRPGASTCAVSIRPSRCGGRSKRSKR